VQQKSTGDTVIKDIMMTDFDLDLGLISDFKNDKMDILGTSIQESGIIFDDINLPEWNGMETDAEIFHSIPTESNVVQDVIERPLSDTSSDSGLDSQQILSPDLFDCITSSKDDDDDDESDLQAVVNPRTNSPDPETVSFDTGATTIILPVITPKSVKVIKSSGQKRRRASASSNDSGLDDAPSSSPKQFVPSQKKGKYPPLELTEEERRICEREGIKLPSHYPLSREEERNLKRIRRKIRNKVSAQDSRKRKKEYLDNMEDRVKACTDENSQLHKRIEQLETQNKTLASQLKRLHNIIVSGGFQTRQNQTSTAMMVLLLSTALFLFPGFKDHQESQKSDVDITQAIKVPPMPGQSRSLLQFAPTLKEEFNVAGSDNAPVDTNNVIINHGLIKEEVDPSSPFHDHDYFVVNTQPPEKSKKKVSYIEADVPPQGYGFVDTGTSADKNGVGGNSIFGNDDRDVYVVVEDEAETQLNVNVTGSGPRTVVLHVPKDIK